ncbi:MAG: response regulator [Ferruginibacter sp.]|nr:response regulator [Ferruginibacter sp.]
METTILLVDDNKEILTFLSKDLQEEYVVFTARNGKEGLKIIEEHSIQLIISDIKMPAMNGFEFCNHLKTSLNCSHIPIILLTAKNTLQSKIEGLQVGADAYIEKPFSPEHLKAQIKNLLANRNKIKEYFAISPLAHMSSMAYSKADEDFLGRLNDFIFSNIENPDLDVDLLARVMNMSRPTLYRKIKEISDLTPSELVSVARLKKAAELLITGEYKIFEVAIMAGFHSQSSFGKAFLKQFKVTPTEFQLLKKNKNSGKSPNG